MNRLDEPRMSPSMGETASHLQRVILLGASNLTYSFPLVIDTLAAACQPGVEIFAAHGHGRSYGSWNRVLVRSLPGICTCRLWHDLGEVRGDRPPPWALITDVGNDLLYGFSPATVAGWVEICLQHLAQHQAAVTLTLLPLASVRRLSAWRFHLTRLCFFPTSDLTFHVMLDRADELNQRLTELGRTYAARLVEPAGHWYGFDPIHVRRRCRPEAWKAILSTWPTRAQDWRISRPPLSEAIRLWRLRPAERRILGGLQAAAQPVLRSDRLLLHLY